MLLQDINTNMVMVVILEEELPKSCNISYHELITKYKYFFHPVNVGSWPKKPPNYIAFFLDNKMLSMHHIESYEVFNDPNDVIAEIESQIWETHYFYLLGKPIMPQSKIKIGKNKEKIIWCMIDTILTAQSLDEALAITEERKTSAAY